jgi:hypothetical protein
MARTALLLLLLVFTSPVPVAVAACPTNTLYAMYASLLNSNASGSFSQSYTCTADGFSVTASGTAAYDLANGRFGVVAQGGAGCGASAALQTHDVFALIGPAFGSPLSFRAQLVVELHGANLPSSATIREGDSNTSRGSKPAPFDTVWVTITRSPGNSFDLYVGASTGGTGFGTLSASLSFPDLPPGYGVQSCQGFFAGTPVQARVTNWGRLRARYR